MKKLFLLFFIPFLISCSHCSRTVTNFDGKPSGLNPYGSGNLVVVREAYWGNLKCILKMLGEETGVCEPEQPKYADEKVNE